MGNSQATFKSNKDNDLKYRKGLKKDNDMRYISIENPIEESVQDEETIEYFTENAN